ncbi:MAG: CinA family protein [Dehalococcoidales bacterium]|jgi:PncC family amidohydrolase|nr:CinA family protein [Dehalococcoidales bacterium]MDX9986242.1 CinA family protein [Dehalococcoidales bacterium]
MNEPESKIARLLTEKGLTLAVVESATGGLISHRITNVSGSSAYYKGSIIAYSNEIKLKMAGVKVETLVSFGAVSYQVATQMAEGGRRALKADICLADTGIAGPGSGSIEKPVGLVYVAIADKQNSASRKYVFTGSREENKASFADAALAWLLEYLEGSGLQSTFS